MSKTFSFTINITSIGFVKKAVIAIVKTASTIISNKYFINFKVVEVGIEPTQLIVLVINNIIVTLCDYNFYCKNLLFLIFWMGITVGNTFLFTFKNYILCLDIPVNVCPHVGSSCYGISNRIDDFHLCIVVKFL